MSGCILFWIKTSLLQNIMGFKWLKSPLRMSDSHRLANMFNVSEFISKSSDITFNGDVLVFWKCISRIVKTSGKQTSYPWYDFLPITKNLFVFSLLCFRCLFVLSSRSLLGPLSVFSICVHFVFARFLLLWFLPIPSCWLREGNQQRTVSGRAAVLPCVSCLMLINKVASGRKRTLLFLILSI